MFRALPINLLQWIAEHREQLKPPVNNRVIWRDSDFIVMIVGGPNHRLDYHVNSGEEFFFQLKGDMALKIVDDGQFKTISIREGEIFLLSANIPHSPQRSADSVGLVIETHRAAGVLDRFQWYCEACAIKLYEDSVAVSDIVVQLPLLFERFYAGHNQCPHCHRVYQ